MNLAILIGHVGNDPEVKQITNDKKVAKFSLATTKRGFKTANGTEVPERTEWHNIAVFGGLANVVEQYVRKGAKLRINGEITHRSYDDKNGVKRFFTEILATEMEMLGNAQGNQNTASPKPYDPAENLPKNDFNNDYGQPTGENEDLPF